MDNHIAHISLIFLLGVSLISCQESILLKSKVSLERWAVSGTAEEYQKDSILYLETQQYNENGILEGTSYYDTDKTLKGQEIRIFKDKKGPVGAQYKDKEDNILSYYTYVTTDEGLLTSSKGFDGSNDELLRLETFEYNSRGHLISKTIKNDQGLPVRVFKYTVDEQGNELQTEVLNADESVLLTEIFQITKYDDQKNWLEKWGFVDDKPFSYLARQIEYK